MAWRSDEPEPVPAEGAFGKITVEHLKPLAALLTGDVPKRKPELVHLLTRFMTDPDEVRTLYERLDPLAKMAVQEAAFEPKGLLHRDRFIARHGRMPDFHPVEEEGSYGYRRRTRPTPLLLFFPRYDWLPTDLRQLLLAFVPSPPAFTLPTVAEPPATVRQTWTTWRRNREVEESADVPLRVRETAREAEQDLRAVLRLIEAGRVRVSDKKRQPTAASQKAVAEVLAGGDFYTAEDQDESKYDPAHDLAVKAFAWPMLVQAAGLAQKSGDDLAPTPAGRKALSAPAPDVLRAIYRKWRTSNLLDEFSRIETIKGQGKGGLSALTGRRKAVLDALAACPAGAWFAADDFFRFLRATDRDFVVAHRPYDLYIAEHYYGNLGYGSEHEWEQLQGRYILALLFEYVATLGLIDVAYLPPQGTRDDFRDRWGTDDLSCLSRYDGLQCVRINPLGAWCLGLAERYETPAVPVVDVLQVLPNLDIVVKRPPLPASDRLVLDRFAEKQSEGVWKLTAAKLLAVLEEGGTLDELEEFLKARCTTALPQTVEVFLKDQRERAGRLRDLGTARLIECARRGRPGRCSGHRPPVARQGSPRRGAVAGVPTRGRGGGAARLAAAGPRRAAAARLTSRDRSRSPPEPTLFLPSEARYNRRAVPRRRSVARSAQGADCHEPVGGRSHARRAFRLVRLSSPAQRSARPFPGERGWHPLRRPRFLPGG